MSMLKSSVQLSIELDDLDPDSIAYGDLAALRDIVAAEEDVVMAEDRLRERVAAAHQRGVSWTAIGSVLGVTRQAARQRFRNV